MATKKTPARKTAKKAAKKTASNETGNRLQRAAKPKSAARNSGPNL